MENKQTPDREKSGYELIPAHLKDIILQGSDEEAQEARRELFQWARLSGTEITSGILKSLEEGRFITKREMTILEKKAARIGRPSFPRRIVRGISRMIRRK